MKIKQVYIFLLLFAALTFAQNGNQLELTSIEFTGNNSISSSELRSVIMSKESPNWFSQFLDKFTSFGGKAIYFDSLIIPFDVQEIKNLYQSNGFFKVHINYNCTIENKEVNLVYTINESSPAYFNNFQISGIDNVPDEFKDRINDYVKVDTNTIYEDIIVEDKKNFALTYLRDHGYMLAKYEKPKILVDTLLNKVDVKINFETGKRYQISNIYTVRTGRGMNLVDDNLLKDIVGIQKGQYYSYYDIQRGQVRLYRTNLFTSAVINSVISDTSSNLVPLNISADVGLLHELAPEIIINNEENTFNLGLALNFTKKNFLGDARKVTIGASAAAQNLSEFLKNPSFADTTVYGYADSRLTIEQPFLLGNPVNTKLETYFTLQKRKNEYNSTIYGAKLSLDFELPQVTYFNSFSTYFNIERAEYTYKENYLVKLSSLFYQQSLLVTKNIADSLATSFVRDSLGGKLISKSTNALLGLSFGANKTDDIFFPTKGYTLSLQFEDANSIPYLISRITKSNLERPLYFKVLASSSLYLPLYSSNDNALGIKFKIGQIFTYKGEKADIPLNQRLYAGGSNSVRGWSTRQLVPSEAALNLANPTQEDLEAVLAKGAATGGFFLLEGSIETRNRLIGRLGTALFIDYGNTWNGYEEFRFDQIAVAGGFGIRYYSDFAPIRIDFGMKIYDPHDRRNSFKKNFWKDILQFHIGIGEAF